jgi:RNA polymerase sigma-70 factor (ECF subfamily)
MELTNQSNASQPVDASSAVEAARQRRQLEAEIIEGILAGDGESFDRLYEMYWNRIYRFAVKRLGDASEAEDVAQDVFLQVHRCLESFEGRSSLLTWMFGIAHHQLCRRFRRKTPHTISLEAPEARARSISEVPSDRRVDATRALESCERVLAEHISPTQREVFHQYYVENRPTKQIASRLGKSTQAVKISLFRTRRALEAHAPHVEQLLSA